MNIYNKKVKLTLLVMLIALFNALSGCNKVDVSNEENETNSGDIEHVTLLTGDTGGTYYVVGAAISDILRKYEPNLIVTPQSTAGGQENVLLINDSPNDIGFSSLGMVSASYAGDNSIYETYTEKNEELRFVLDLYPMPLHVVTLADSDISSISDLKGKKIATIPGATTSQAPLILSYSGLEEGDYELIPLGHADGSDALRDGKVDALFFYIGIPSPSIMDLSSQADIKFISFEKEALDNLIKDNPHLNHYTIAKNTYEGQTEDAYTFEDPVIIFSHEDASTEAIYTLVKKIFEYSDELKEIHPSAGNADLEKNLNMIESLSIPVHPGAEKYFNEVR